jgi:hypothetical protein
MQRTDVLNGAPSAGFAGAFFVVPISELTTFLPCV